MKKYLLLLTIVVIATFSTTAQTSFHDGTGTNPDASAMGDFQSTTKGFLVPRMTAVQRAGIGSPATGLLIYQTDGTAGFYYNSGTPGTPAWVLIAASSGSGFIENRATDNVAATGQSANFDITGSGEIGTTLKLSGTSGTILSSTDGGVQTIALSNDDITNANNLSIADPGPSEGIGWNGTAASWKIDVSPLDRSNADGNLNLYGSNGNISLWRPSLFVYNATNYTTATPQSSGGLNFTSTGNGHLTFNPGGTGNVGIGVTGPTQKLEVSGITLSNAFRTRTGNTDYHHLLRTGGGAAVYINQTDATSPILRLSSGTATANVGVVATFENNGYVGIGNSSPAAMLSVGSSSQFRVNTTGAITAATGITSNGTITFSGLTPAGIVTNTAGGVLGTTATVPVGNLPNLAGDVSGALNSNVVADDSHDHTYLKSKGQYVWNAATLPRDFPQAIATSFVQAADGWPSYGSVVHVGTYPNDGGSLQLYAPYNATYGGNSLRYRLGLYNNAGWTGWKTIWDDTNDGAGSGMDADLLDGQHGSYYATSSGSGNYIQNQISAAQTSSNYWISGTGRAAAFQLNDANTSLTEAGGNALRIGTNYGYIDIGPQNASWAHIQTDRASFYFNPKITVDGNVEPYTTGTKDLGTSSLRWRDVYSYYHDVTPGDGYGIRFWESDSYKIHMGNAGENHYGPVTSYSIKTNMSNNAGRGWTWGVTGSTPVAAIEATTGTMQIGGNFAQGPLIARPRATWSAGGTSTGAVIIKLPGNTGNYGMLHMEVDVYEYGTTGTTTYILGGHNWNGQWYNYTCQTIGTSNKKVRLAVVGGQYAIVLGETGSSWSYGHVVLSKITTGGYYSGIMDLSGTYTAYLDNAAVLTWSTADLNSSTNPSVTTNYIQNQNSTTQTANFNISGYGYAGNYFQSPTMYVSSYRHTASTYENVFADNNSSGGFHLYRNDGNSWGYFYGDASGIGILNGSGNWAILANGSVNATNTAINLYTDNTQRVWLNSTGMGIGASPGAKLDVQGASGIRIGNSTYDANLVFGNNASWKSGIRVYDNGDAEMRIWHANSLGQIVLATGYNGDQSAVMPSDGLFIDQNKVGIGYASPAAATGKLLVNGNVGIGTTAPTEKLSVAGAITSANFQVKRDFVTWNTTAGSGNPVHIKTNIPYQSNVMYRILVEGYNYGNSQPINSEAVGYTYSGWTTIANAVNVNQSSGVSISQYYSSDGYVVIKLNAGSFYYAGFSVSAWLTNPAGNAFDIKALSIVQQAYDMSSPCTHTIYLYDSYGDGWHGNNFVYVSVNGSLVVNAGTLSSGYGPQSYSFSAIEGSSIQVTFSGGSWPGECYYDIVDGTGNYLVDNWWPSSSGTWNGTANCY